MHGKPFVMNSTIEVLNHLSTVRINTREPLIKNNKLQHSTEAIKNYLYNCPGIRTVSVMPYCIEINYSEAFKWSEIEKYVKYALAKWLPAYNPWNSDVKTFDFGVKMREPTKEEMVEGIAKGFKLYLESQPTYSCLSSSGIKEAIENGIKLAYLKIEKAKDRLW